MIDSTEGFRKFAKQNINSQVRSNDPASERQRLEALHGEVWNTAELPFQIKSFLAPYCTTVEGLVLEFQDRPRFYWRVK